MKKITTGIAALLLCFWLLPQSVCAAKLLVPGGQVIGIVLEDDTVTVAAFDEELGKTCKAAGLKVGDRLLSVNGKAVTSAQEVRDILSRCDGQVELVVLRGDQQKQFRLQPEATAQGPRLGLFLRQGITGVGTVTWYDPDTGDFGALGHGVNTAGGQLVQMTKGNVYTAGIFSVKKGKSGAPGQLVGSLSGEAPIGTLSKNTRQGVFGNAKNPWSGQELPVAEPEDVKVGPATIRSTVGSNLQEYSVEILKIYPNDKAAGRNMLLRITDPALLEATGGIVQGMSGSPIIQDGKLVGAVTHVLVNDPTTGYGIFIENMLDAAA